MLCAVCCAGGKPDRRCRRGTALVPCDLSVVPDAPQGPLPAAVVTPAGPVCPHCLWLPLIAEGVEADVGIPADVA